MENKQGKSNKGEKCAQDNLRTEYTALSSYFGTVITFRFTTLGLYLAAAGLILQAATLVSSEKGFLLLCVTLPIWIVELRNRTIFRDLVNRGMEIENVWNAGSEKAPKRFYQCMTRDKNDVNKSSFVAGAPRPLVGLRFFVWDIPLSKCKNKKVPRVLSHTFGIDLLYLIMVLHGLIV